MPRTGARGGPQTRAKVREVANRLFIERGFDSVTVADIAKEAGVSSVTVFNHFPTKEDLFLDRTEDAASALRSAIRDRTPDTDALTSLRQSTFRLFDDRHPLSGVDERSGPFYRTVAQSPALLARARAISSDLQQVLTEELDQDPTFEGDATLLAAFFVAGYAAVFVGTARLFLADEPYDAVVADHRARLDRFFEALQSGVGRVRH